MVSHPMVDSWELVTQMAIEIVVVADSDSDDKTTGWRGSLFFRQTHLEDFARPTRIIFGVAFVT